jgi:hypothetical protein
LLLGQEGLHDMLCLHICPGRTSSLVIGTWARAFGLHTKRYTTKHHVHHARENTRAQRNI